MCDSNIVHMHLGNKELGQSEILSRPAEHAVGRLRHHRSSLCLYKNEGWGGGVIL